MTWGIGVGPSHVRFENSPSSQGASVPLATTSPTIRGRPSMSLRAKVSFGSPFSCVPSSVQSSSRNSGSRRNARGAPSSVRRDSDCSAATRRGGGPDRILREFQDRAERGTRRERPAPRRRRDETMTPSVKPNVLMRTICQHRLKLTPCHPVAGSQFQAVLTAPSRGAKRNGAPPPGTRSTRFRSRLAGTSPWCPGRRRRGTRALVPCCGPTSCSARRSVQRLCRRMADRSTNG